jgi:uncharacterized glyoxalase superfamily protein PhnB
LRRASWPDGFRGEPAGQDLRPNIWHAHVLGHEDPEVSAESGGARPIRIILTVDDPDALFERAVAGGAKQVASVHEEYGWRTGRVTDPFGHDWEFSKPVSP